MKRLRRSFLFLFLILAASFLQSAFPNSAHAFPGFARKYNFPCSFCHIQWPRLADTGHFFKDRGFMLSTTGRGNGLDMMFQDPKNQNYFPIGFHMSFAYKGSAVNGINTHGNTTQNTSGSNATTGYGNFTGPITGNGGWANGAYSAPAWDIESGGLIAPWISFWVQPGAGFTGGNAAPGAASIQTPALGLVKLWIRFDDLLHSTWFNIYVGKTSNDSPESTYRSMGFQMVAKGDPYIYEDYEPGVSEIVQNDSVLTSGFAIPGIAALYNDGDDVGYNNAWAQIRYFGYHFEGTGQACQTQSGFSTDPCETRVDVNFVPNSGLFATGTGDGASVPAFCAGGVSAGCTLPTNEIPSNGWNYTVRVTQSFGGWGRTNGEQIGVWDSVIEGTALPQFGGGANPMGVANRFGVSLMTNPIPNGGLNIDAVWDIVNDPTSFITPALPGMGAATQGLEYMAWYVDVSWQPTFGGLLPQSGAGSNLIELIYNQVDMMMQPQFQNFTVPGNFNDVIAFQLLDRYWLWGSDRADVSLFAQYQYMVNFGVAGVLSAWSTAANPGGNSLSGGAPGGFFGNVEANNFTVGVDFAY